VEIPLEHLFPELSQIAVYGDASTAEVELLASGVVVFAVLFALAQTKCKDT
jgi:hypothetical protein